MNVKNVITIHQNGARWFIQSLTNPSSPAGCYGRSGQWQPKMKDRIIRRPATHQPPLLRNHTRLKGAYSSRPKREHAEEDASAASMRPPRSEAAREMATPSQRRRRSFSIWRRRKRSVGSARARRRANRSIGEAARRGGEALRGSRDRRCGSTAPARQHGAMWDPPVSPRP